MVGDVGVELTRQPTKGGLDRALVRVARDAEDLVVVASSCGHARRVLPPVAGTGSALVQLLDEA
jgi:hypothetical protein